jgi:hypothetical protein
LAYVASLEERIRNYEQSGIQANLSLQKLAKRLDLENRKLKRTLFEIFGINEIEIENADSTSLLESIKSKMASWEGGSGSEDSFPTSRNSFSGGVIKVGASTSIYTEVNTPFRMCCPPSAPISDVRSQKPPTPPPSKDDHLSKSQNLLESLEPKAKPASNCGDNLSIEGQQFCGLLQLLASSNKSTPPSRSVSCKASMELIKSLLEVDDKLTFENVAIELKTGLYLGEDGCRVDSILLAKVLHRMANLDEMSKKTMEVDNVPYLGEKVN